MSEPSWIRSILLIRPFFTLGPCPKLGVVKVEERSKEVEASRVVKVGVVDTGVMEVVDIRGVVEVVQ